jgi:hypothetical protein
MASSGSANKRPHLSETILYLIREELKSQKFFSILQDAGIHDCYFQPRLDKLILSQMELDDGTDETFEEFYRIIERRMKKLEPKNESVRKQALKVYVDLLDMKKRRR